MPDTQFQNILNRFDKTEPPANKKKVILSVALIIFAGILSGYLLSRFFGLNKISTASDNNSENSMVQKIVGVDNEKVFPDSATGELEEGGIDGEGTHKLIRPGGPSQTVYLTSSILDLSEFVGKNIKVWGETRGAEQAGWLMDVGKVEILQ